MEPLDARRELLARLRGGRSRRGPGGAADGRAPGAGSGTGEGPDHVSLFRERFEASGGTFFEGPAIDPFLPALGEALRLEGVTALLCAWDDPAARALAEAVSPFGPFPIVTDAEVRQAAPPVTAGIQSAEAAIAETGTIVQSSGGGRSLLPGLLVDVHIALLAPGIFLPRMEECLAAFAASPPRTISLITGPSRSGDIEQTLTVGAHGPRKVIALLVR